MTGDIVLRLLDAPMDGCLPCDGSEVKQAEHPALWAQLPQATDGKRRTPDLGVPGQSGLRWVIRT